MRHKIDPDAPVIVLSITLKGEDIAKKIDMALDTGATYTMIPWEIAEILGLCQKFMIYLYNQTTINR